MFVDYAKIVVKAGDGGRGCTAFAQPPYIRYPYPDGGDGGSGGNVMLRADPNIATLLDFRYRHLFSAGRGGHGGSNAKMGRRGDDVVISVPVGTVIRETASGHLVRDLMRPHDEIVVATGGRGGIGNANSPAAIRKRLHARTGVAPVTVPRGRRTSRKAPQPSGEATPGKAGEQRQITLELKLIADVGLVGCPNAGKSSLLSRISTARPKIGAYPFTTRYPVLGVADVEGRGAFVACDIPGLIEGAHSGKGLGLQFLRHIERTRLLVHLIDMAAVDGRDPLRAFHQLNHELAAYSPALARKPQLVVSNKMDLPQAAAHARAFQRAMQRASTPIFLISCATGRGIPELLQAIWRVLSTASSP